jgi:hypothetical protein
VSQMMCEVSVRTVKPSVSVFPYNFNAVALLNTTTPSGVPNSEPRQAVQPPFVHVNGYFNAKTAPGLFCSESAVNLYILKVALMHTRQ